MPRKIFKLLLASRSPRRREILKDANLSCMVIPSNSSESFDENLTLDENLKAVAETKVMTVVSRLSARKLKGKVILGADTVVAVGKAVLGKPKNVHDAKRMMGLLNGKIHVVKTGFCLFCPDQKKKVRRVITTKVGFRKLSKADIQWYVNSREPFGKAGGYGIQGLARNFVNYLSGDFLNVVGLPLTAVREELRKHRWYVTGNQKRHKRSEKNRRS
jgi:septum formation protein